MIWRFRYFRWPLAFKKMKKSYSKKELGGAYLILACEAIFKNSFGKQELIMGV